MQNEVLSQFTAAAVVVYALQMLKKSAWFPWLNQQTTHLNRFVSAVGALISAVGVGWAFAPVAGVAGAYTVSLTGLTWGNIALGVWHWANSFAAQQLLYDGVVSKTSPQTPQAVTSVPQPASVKSELQGVKL